MLWACSYWRPLVLATAESDVNVCFLASARWTMLPPGLAEGGGGEEEDRALTDVSHEGAMATPLGVALMASKVLPTPG